MEEKYKSILSRLPCPVSKLPAGGENETYVTFNQVYGNFSVYSSNKPRRARHMVQVHVFTRREDGYHLTLMDQAVVLLLGEGVRIVSWGPDEYEEDTRYHHIAITTEFYTTI